MHCQNWFKARILAFVLSLFSVGSSAQVVVIPLFGDEDSSGTSVANTAHVAISGGDYASPVNALNDIATWCGTPSANNPCLVKLAPGTYDVGSTAVVLPAHVGLRGAGQKLSTITGTVTSSGLLRLAGDNTTLADLTVVNDANAANISAVTIGKNASGSNVNVKNWRLNNLRAEANNGTTSTSSVFFPFGIDCSSGAMYNVFATAVANTGNARGIEFGCGTGSISGSDIMATTSGGTTRIGLIKFHSGSTLTVRNSSFAGTTQSVKLDAGTIKVISTELDGPVDGTVICVGDYNAAGVALVDGTNGSGGCVTPP